MRYIRTVIIAIEILALALLSLCGVVAFSNSGIYSGVISLGNRYLPAITTYHSLIIFLLLFCPGLFFVVLKNKEAGVLASVVFVINLPVFFSFNNIDLLKIFGSTTQITTQIPFFQMLSIGALIISLYLLLNLINEMKLVIQKIKFQQTTLSDINIVFQHQLLLAIILTGGALLISLIITGVARGFEYLFSKYSWVLSWWIVPVTILFVLVLGIYLYWITTRKNAQS
jgi:hypothetical protein